MTTRPLIILITVLVFAAAGCGGSKNSNAGASSSAGPQQQSGPTLVIDITIGKGDVTPTNGQWQAKVNQPIEFRVDSDADDELHVHSSPDHEFPVESKQGQTFQFSVNVPGQVEVELHKLDKTVGTIQVKQ